jgi:hypothetical protein
MKRWTCLLRLSFLSSFYSFFPCLPPLISPVSFFHADRHILQDWSINRQYQPQPALSCELFDIILPVHFVCTLQWCPYLFISQIWRPCCKFFYIQVVIMIM